MQIEFSDTSGEAWFSIFNEEAETLLGCSAAELVKMKAQEEVTQFQIQLKKAKWIMFLFRVVVSPTMYKNVKRQKIHVIVISTVDFATDARTFLDDISLMKG